MKNICNFTSLHPWLIFIDLMFVIIFSMFSLSPILLIISLIGAITYLCFLKKHEVKVLSLKYIIFMALLFAVLNPLFNHQGTTAIFFLPNGNAITLESLLFGLASGIMLISVFSWFSIFSAVMESDKLLCVMGKILPSISLMFTITLRFVPAYARQFKAFVYARKCLGKDISKGSLFERAKNACLLLSAMISWAMENGLETADSMKARAFGYCRRTNFNTYIWLKRDRILLSAILVSIVICVVYAFCGMANIRFFPSIKWEYNILQIPFYCAYVFLSFLPIATEIIFAGKWRSIYGS